MLERLKHIDLELFWFINSSHSAFTDQLMWQLSKDWPTVLFVIVFLIYVYRKSKIKTTASVLLGVLLTVACTDLSTNIIKHNVKRYRPSHNLEIKERVHLVNNYKGGTFGFFSSHAANAFGIITFLFLLSKHLGLRYRYLFFLYPFVVSLSRVYLGVHYPSDVFVGACSGLLFGSLIYTIVLKYFVKFDHANA
jgi:undecaprenyl-diphosphatase